jgi:class 3 adenylate cyclase
MAACGSCGAGNPDGYRFCGQCGSSLAVSICGSCGRQNPAGQAFCGECGIPLDTPLKGTGLESQRTSGDPGKVPESELEERKLATVLFADVVGFTSLADKTDHEVVARMVDAAFRRLSEVVAEHGGIVDKYMGDSVMAVFGVPVAHDDDAERAVAAGLAMRELGGDLAFSIGINSGEVMAAYVGRAGDFTVIGDTVNVAARLEKIASAGEVLCGRLTVELAGRVPRA